MGHEKTFSRYTRYRVFACFGYPQSQRWTTANHNLEAYGRTMNHVDLYSFLRTAKNRVTVQEKSTNQASWIFSTSFALNSLNLTNPLAWIHQPSFHLQQNPIIQIYTRSSHLIRYSTEVSTKTFLSKVDSFIACKCPFNAIVNQVNRFFVPIEARKANVYYVYRSNDEAWNYEFFGIFNSKVPKHRHDSL